MRLYLDLDGVINSYGCRRIWGDVNRIAMPSGGEMYYSPRMLNSLKSLRGVGNGLEIIWLSSYMQDCRAISRELGLGQWGAGARVLGPVSGYMSLPSIYWKAEALWDDLDGYSGYWSWFDPGAENLWDHPDFWDLLESPMGFVPDINVNVGLNPAHLVGLEIRMEKEKESEV